MALNIVQALLVYIAGGISFFVVYCALSMNERTKECKCCMECGEADVCSSSCFRKKITCDECSMRK